MTICSQCQFDNPGDNRFCQKCGAPLDVSLESSHQSDSDDGQAEEGGGKSWLALCVRSQDDFDPQRNGIPQDYLDAQQRYRRLAPGTESASAEIEIRVEDCQPSLVSEFMTWKQGYLGTADPDSIPDESPTYQIPMRAQPYLILWKDLFQNLPEIHDAWQQDGQTVLVLEDYSHLPQLLDFWGNEDIIIPQIVYLLRELTNLWMALTPWKSCQSLLEVDNLRMDEDEILCLKRLYADSPDHPPTLQDLGQLFFKLFEQSNRTLFGPLITLCADLNAGKITEVDDLKSQLDAIAADLESAPPAVDVADVDAALGINQDAEPGRPPDFPPELPSWGDASADDDDFREGGDATVALPMRLLSVEDAGRTDIGRQRDHNEDCFSIHTQLDKFDSPRRHMLKAKGLYILCDGMGGHASGEVASATAVDALQEYFEEHWQDQLPSEDVVREAICQANTAIYDINQKDERAGSGRMGTTLVMLLIQGNQAIIAHVGDSRLYSVSRRQGLRQRTVDHEVGQREIQRGVDPEVAYSREDAYQLTQALGPRDSSYIKPSVQRMELSEGQLLLLCSDGLSDNDLLEKNFKTHVESLLSSRANLEKGIDDLMTLANKDNGHDNITVILVRIKVRPNLEQMPT